MSYRPYPNPTRARHQIDRHDDETPPQTQVGQRPLSPLEKQFFEAAAAVGEALRPQLQDIGASLRAAFQPRPVSSKGPTA
jgi:hypothetical protein